MKELTIEQKAQRYDEAIKVAKSKIKNDNDHVLYEKDITDIFPELSEIGDDRIRKKLISYFSAIKGFSTLEYNYGITNEDAVAWLEKQEQKPADTNNKFIRMRENKPKDISEFLNRLTTVEQEFLWEHIAKIRKLDKEEQVEQKPAWSEDDEMFVHGLIRGLAAKRDIHGHTTFSSDCIDITETIHWLESLKNRVLLYPVSVEYNEEDIDNIADTFIPEPVWNALEESEGEGSNAAAYDYSQMIAMFKAGVHWLKFLKDRVQLQPKQEWSEEDER